MIAGCPTPEAIPHLVLPPITFPSVLAPCAARVNINSTIMAAYLGKILPGEQQGGRALRSGKGRGKRAVQFRTCVFEHEDPWDLCGLDCDR